MKTLADSLVEIGVMTPDQREQLRQIAVEEFEADLKARRQAAERIANLPFYKRWWKYASDQGISNRVKHIRKERRRNK